MTVPNCPSTQSPNSLYAFVGRSWALITPTRKVAINSVLKSNETSRPNAGRAMCSDRRMDEPAIVANDNSQFNATGGCGYLGPVKVDRCEGG